MKIGIFGGTFNPPHKAHLEIAKKLLNQFKIDKVYFVPSNISPHKLNKNVESNIHRLEMLKLLINKNSKLKISDYEIKKGGVSYTINTLKYFRKKSKELFLIIGSDNYKDLYKWKDYNKIKKICKIIIIPRPNSNFKKNSEFLYLKNIYSNISSTIVREYLNQNKNCSELISKKIFNYIVNNKLYLK